MLDEATQGLTGCLAREGKKSNIPILRKDRGNALTAYDIWLDPSTLPPFPVSQQSDLTPSVGAFARRIGFVPRCISPTCCLSLQFQPRLPHESFTKVT